MSQENAEIVVMLFHDGKVARMDTYTTSAEALKAVGLDE